MKSPVTGESSVGVQIGVLARLTGVPVKTIRFYSDIGLLPPAARTSTRYRLYGGAHRVRLEQIRTLRELGFGLGAIAGLLQRRADPHALVAAQLAAIERERSHLARAGAVLRAALAGADPADAALRVGAILKLSALQRASALRQQLAAPLRDTKVDPTWLDQLLGAAFDRIPDDLDDDQWAALVELVALVTDPSFGDALAKQSRPFWVRARRFDPKRWQRRWVEILRAGTPLVAAGVEPVDPRAVALADRYLMMIARATGRRPTKKTISWILARAAEHDPRAERFWELVAILHRRPAPPHAAIMRVIHAALRMKIA
ncbi:MAG TPA: MerR family transcriptional regulator [Kofleriaceae bacterium]|nr:MerR family transcriptional regulator [Kofleriaceae bacterium]